MKSAHRYCIYVMLLVMYPAAGGCDPGLDSWSNYTSGGFFDSGTPSLAPDNSKIVFSSPRTGRGDIYFCDLNGNERKRLTSNPCFEAQPVYSPDGTLIAFVREENGYQHIFVMDTDGRNELQLTYGRVFDRIVSFSQDASHIWFRRAKPTGGFGLQAELYYVSVRGQRKIERVIGQKVTPIAISPDENTLLYTHRSKNGATNEIWTSDRSGERYRQIGTGYAPSFSGDGRHIFFIGCGKENKVFVMGADGSNIREVELPRGHKTQPRPSWDNQYMLITVIPQSKRVGEIYKIGVCNLDVIRIASME